ncbi:MAG: D-glycero-beta-D-manno-heptose-7-phosphate kinase [bacterium]
MTGVAVARVREILAGVRGKRVVVVGDVMVDRYLWGSVSRISPEAPVPVVEIARETSRLGGAANVASNVVSLGAACSLCGLVGQDHEGESLTRRLEDHGIAAAGLVRVSGRPTTVKTRIMAHNQQVVRADRETREDVTGEPEARLRSAVSAALATADAVIISDYGKGAVTEGLLGYLIPAARSAGRIVSADPKERQFRNYRGVSLITPNQFEAGGIVGRRITDEDSLMAVGWEVFDMLAPDALLVTRGENGMSLFEGGRRYKHFATVARQVYDVTGAGDTVIASFTLCLAAGATTAEAAQIANHAAGVVIREVGTATVGSDDLIASFDALHGGPGGRAGA